MPLKGNINSFEKLQSLNSRLPQLIIIPILLVDVPHLVYQISNVIVLLFLVLYINRTILFSFKFFLLSLLNLVGVEIL